MDTAGISLSIYPLLFLILTLAGSKHFGKGSFNEEYLNLSSSKALQSIAALGIVLHHVVQIQSQYWSEDIGPVTVFNNLGIYFVAIFFFFSGYGLITSYKTKPGYLDGFLRKRLTTILVPFYVTNIFFLIVLYKYRIYSPLHLVLSILGLTLINSHAWYIAEILVLYLAFYFSYKYIKKESAAFRTVCVFTVLLIAASLLLGHEYSGTGRWFMGEWWYESTPFFLAGMAVGRGREKFTAFLKKHYALLTALSFAVFVVFFFIEFRLLQVGIYYMEWDGHPGYREKLCAFLIQQVSQSAFIMAMLLSTLKFRIGNRFLTFIGKLSLELYLIHGLFLEAVRYEVIKLPDILVFPAVLAVGIALAWPLSIVDRRIIRCLTGAKKS